MPANKFEKQVQDIMEDLKLPPSPPVWKNIEEQIRKKKDRRRIIFWFLFLSLILAGGLWIMIGTNNKETNNQQAKLEQTHSNSKTTVNGSQKNQNNSVDKQNKSTVEIMVSRNNNAAATPRPIIAKQHPGQELVIKRSVTKNQKKEEQNLPVVAYQNEPATTKEQKETVVNSMLPDQKSKKQTDIVIEQPLRTETLIVATEQNSGTKKISDSTSETKEPVSETSNPVQQKNKKSGNKKWQKRITAEIGWSDYNYGLPEESQKSYSPASIQSSFSPLRVYSPQEITKGQSLVIGFQLIRSMTRHIEVSLGLQYHYFSTHTKTGATVEKDSAINYGADVIAISRYYRNGNQSGYTNSFHVIEFPVAVDYKPFKNIPVDLGIGFSYGRLFKTNALSFNRQSNIYYQNRQAYRSDYLNAFTSLQYSWLQKSKFKIQSGPILFYSCSKLKNENYFNTPYLFSVGLKSSIIF
jgi:hypothetical protein